MSSERNNAFTFLRLLLALAVVWSHSYFLGGFGNDPLCTWSHGGFTTGNMAVIGFFILSGFLLTQSLTHHPSVARFCLHRAARILPGYWVALLFMALVLAPALIAFPGKLTYVQSLRVEPNSPLAWLTNNWWLEIRQHTIGSIFQNSPVNPAFNGSLWTLFHEAMCYLGLLLLFVARALKPRITVVLWASVYGIHILDFVDHRALIQMAPMVTMTCQYFFSQGLRALYLGFICGIVISQLGWHRNWSLGWFSLAAGLLVISVPLGFLPLIWPLALPYLLLQVAYRLPVRNVERFGDCSYGIYIYAFPLQQCLVQAEMHRFGLLPFFTLSIALAFFAGALSWFFVERPVLHWVRSLSAKSALPDPSALQATAA